MTVRAGRCARASSRHGRLTAGATLLALGLLLLPATAATAQEPAPPLQPTTHEPVPAQPADFWLAPVPAAALTTPLKDFARAVAVLEGGGDPTSVAALVASATLDQSPIADHVKYYRGLIALRQGRLDAAAATFGSLRASATRTWIAEQTLWRLAETQEQRGEYALAAETLARLLASKPGEPDRVAHQLGVARERAGDAAGAVEAHRLAYYDYPLSPDAAASGDVLERLASVNVPFPARLEKTRARAAALYAAKRWALARAAYVEVAAATSGDDHDAAEVRIAAADVQAKQFRVAADRLRPLTGAGAHQAEAQLHYALALRGLGDVDGYVQAARALADGHRQSPYAEEALDGLALWYVLRDDDAAAAETFGLLVQRFPAGRFAERAAWKAGWWAYRQRNDVAAIAYFETGARNFPRSDYRPPWLYWSGRAKQRLGDTAGASARFVLTATDYHNSYYGRLALAQLGEAAAVPTNVREAAGPRPAPPPTERQIALLLALGLHDVALAEAQFARRVFGDSPALQATVALAHHRAGRLRPAINAMKRAYPQYLASGGQSLPPDVLRVIFPIDYWQQLEGSARRRGLDPYVVVALAAQESTFDAGIASSAGAIGLMQIMPATGRSVARQLGIKPFSTSRLTDPEVNMAIGTEYFGDLVAEFGHPAYALAGYNAGGHRVRRWKSERPGLPIDEWIDDIPFPETQNYVKRILGTAEDYRRLYGGGVLKPVPLVAPAPSAAPAKKVRPPSRRRPAPATKTPPARRRPRG